MGQIFGTIILLLIVAAILQKFVAWAGIYLQIFFGICAVMLFLSSVRDKENRFGKTVKSLVLAFLAVAVTPSDADKSSQERGQDNERGVDEISVTTTNAAKEDNSLLQTPGPMSDSSNEMGVAISAVTQDRLQTKSITDHASKNVESSPLWLESGWISCQKTYKNTFRATGKPAFYRYHNRECGELSDLRSKLDVGDCYMNISGPGGVVAFKDFEVSLHCVNTTPQFFSGPTCSNAANFYAEELERQMRSDPRCAGFPDLLSKRLKEPPSSGYTESIKKHERSGKYEDLPNAIKYSNRNTDERCRRAVNEVRRLENHPSFDLDRSIRKDWQRKFDLAMNQGCEL